MLLPIKRQGNNLTARRSDATIKALEADNKWLKEQLDQAKTQAPDILVKSLADRGKVLEEELKRLVSDRENNQVEIKNKEAEIEKNKAIQAELQKLIQKLQTKVDVCPFCDANLKTKMYLEPGAPLIGTEREYYCGYRVISDNTGREEDEKVGFCPSDPDYPEIEEFRIEYQRHIMEPHEWFFSLWPKSNNARDARVFEIKAATESEALENLRKRYYAKYPFI